MMALYQELVKADVVGPISQEIEMGGMDIDPATQRIVLKRKSLKSRPWLYGAIDIKRKCPLWYNIFFYKYGILASPCLGCWKIAYAPPNLKLAFATFDLLVKLGKQKIPWSNHTFYGKVGAETRPNTGRVGGYTAMFYSPLGKDLNFARRLRDELEKRLRAQVDADASPILKRGCTEFENRFSPSSDWDHFYKEYGWERTEALITSIVPMYSRQRRFYDYPIMQVHVKRLMIEHAFEHNDLTYLEYTGGVPMVAPLVDYTNTDYTDADFEMGCYSGSNFEPHEDMENDTNSDRLVAQEGQAGQAGEAAAGGAGLAGPTSSGSGIIRLSELE